MIHNNILDAIGNTPMVRLSTVSPKPEVNIYVKLEGVNPSGSVKDRVAKRIIERAEADGMLTKDKVIIEPTSGNTGIALAMIGRLKGYEVEVVIAENVSSERIAMLSAYGAKIHFPPAEGGSNTAVKVAEEIAGADDRYFMPYQYGNDANPRAHYEGTAVEILKDLPNINVFVAGLGTGGTLVGVGQRLKEHNPDVRVIAAAPELGDSIEGLRDLEAGFIPPILEDNDYESLLDGRYLIENKAALERTRHLLNSEGIFAGISTGAAIDCAVRVADKMARGNIVCLSADGGWKYLSTGVWGTDSSLKEAEIAVHW